MTMQPIAVFFHSGQLAFNPRYEWSDGERVPHPEVPARAEQILATLQAVPKTVQISAPDTIPWEVIEAVHHPDLLTLYRTAKALPEGAVCYPCVFPRETILEPDPNNLHQAGFYATDTATPLDKTVLEAAGWSAACAVEAARWLLAGYGRLAYALCRPPGHHAFYRSFGGYCYFNNAALAATWLRAHGRVAVVDIDFHHGNGTQQLFYQDNQVLVVSLHADPREHYPYTSGFAVETGQGAGTGFNLNLPLSSGTTGEMFLTTLVQNALPVISRFQPNYMVLSAGFDTYRHDPLGGFLLDTTDYHAIGRVLGRLGVPVVVVQEGGYYLPHLGQNVWSLLAGLREGLAGE